MSQLSQPQTSLQTCTQICLLGESRSCHLHWIWKQQRDKSSGKPLSNFFDQFNGNGSPTERWATLYGSNQHEVSAMKGFAFRFTLCWQVHLPCWHLAEIAAAILLWWFESSFFPFHHGLNTSGSYSRNLTGLQYQTRTAVARGAVDWDVSWFSASSVWRQSL